MSIRDASPNCERARTYRFGRADKSSSYSESTPVISIITARGPDCNSHMGYDSVQRSWPNMIISIKEAMNILALISAPIVQSLGTYPSPAVRFPSFTRRYNWVIFLFSNARRKLSHPSFGVYLMLHHAAAVTRSQPRQLSTLRHPSLDDAN